MTKRKPKKLAPQDPTKGGVYTRDDLHMAFMAGVKNGGDYGEPSHGGEAAEIQAWLDTIVFPGVVASIDKHRKRTAWSPTYKRLVQRRHRQGLR